MLSRQLYILMFFFFTSSLNGLFAQHAYKPEVLDPLLEPWRWKFMPELRGKGIRCIENTPEGVLWFGTDKGACRYDGMDWGFYDTTNSEICFPINTLISTNEGAIYAGSEKGLSVYKNQIWKLLFPKAKNELLSISCLKILKNGAVLAGFSKGLIYINKDEIIFFVPEQNLNTLKQSFGENEFIVLPSNYIFSNYTSRVDDIFENSPDDLWILMSQSSQGKIFKFNLNKSINEKKVSKSEVVTEIASNSLCRGLKVIQTKDNKIWIISSYYRSGIFTFNGKKWELIRLSKLFGGDELHTSIMESKDGSILVGGIGKLFVLKNDKWNLYEAPQFPIPYSRVIFHESNNGIWIAGLQNDVYRFDYSDTKWSTYKNLNFECESADQKKWFLSVDNKVVVNDADRWYSYDETDSIIDAPARLIVTKSGTIWAAGSHKSVAATAYFDGKSWHRQSYPQLSWGIDYRAVYESLDGNIWLGASVDALELKGHLSGVIRLKPELAGKTSWTHYSANEGIHQGNAYGIGQSKDGALWMGGTQLLRFDGQKWSNLEQPEYLKQFIDCIYSKPNQNLWVGSRFYGLFSFNGNSWRQFNTENGLSSNAIISIYSENDSTVWVATDNDICRFDGKIWTRELFHPQLILTREGGSLVKSGDGSLWINKSLREWKRRAFTFNSAPKIAYENFRTVRYKPDKLAPKTTIQVYTKEVDHAGNTVISWIGKDYWEDTPTNQLAYSYRLNNGEWSSFDKQNYHTFTNLSDGTYTFEVRARDLDFNIDPTPAKITFVVLPAVWKQTWFILLLMAFIAAIAYYEIQSYRRNRKLNRLNQSLSEINRVLFQQKEEISAKNDEITSHQEQILHQKNQLEYSNILLEKQNLEIKAQRDKLEEMVQQIEDLSQTKLSFFTNISHEFRTPLTLILGPIDRLISTKITDEIEKFNLYGVIYRSANRLLRLINQILEFRKLETGAVDFNPRTSDIVPFLKEVVNLFNGLAIQRKINLSFVSQKETFQTAFDHDKIEKIVFNLLSNAFKFTSEFGSISLELLEVQIEDDSMTNVNRNFIQINVIDTGKGIAAEHLPRIFERFYQVKETSQPSGTGIGLAYIKDLVEIHGGKISVTSEIGKGSCFMVIIPFLTEDNQTVDRLPDTYTSKMHFAGSIQPVINEISENLELTTMERGKVKEISYDGNESKDVYKVLIVEDDLELMTYLKSNLTQFICITAQNGKEGLEKAMEYQPDLVISDIMMPEMDGIELCQLLKTGLITSHIPVILLTARILVENKIEGLESGADDYIEKPFNMQLLQIRAKNLIDSRKNLRELFRKEVIIEPSKVTVTSSDEKLLKGVIDVIEKNIAEPSFNIEDLCRNFYLSRSHFSRKIKQITSFSPKELLNSYRLKRAAQLILENKITIAEISYMVGFEHPNSLSRAFRKQFGASPTEYAEKFKQN
jgi:signal transduction histidine kinase/AraC-like DNA-binding protein